MRIFVVVLLIVVRCPGTRSPNNSFPSCRYVYSVHIRACNTHTNNLAFAYTYIIRRTLCARRVYTNDVWLCGCVSTVRLVASLDLNYLLSKVGVARAHSRQNREHTNTPTINIFHFVLHAMQLIYLIRANPGQAGPGRAMRQCAFSSQVKPSVFLKFSFYFSLARIFFFSLIAVNSKFQSSCHTFCMDCMRERMLSFQIFAFHSFAIH